MKKSIFKGVNIPSSTWDRITVSRVATLLAVLAVVVGTLAPGSTTAQDASSHKELAQFFSEWRTFHTPEVIDGVPDYSETAMNRQHQALAEWQRELADFDTTGWPIGHQVDWYLVWAEMNGLDFAHRVKRPWARDPAFYVWFYPSPTDIPEREGPQVHGTIEFPRYASPLSTKDAAEIATRLRLAPAVFEQARTNLTGNAADLWTTGTRSIREHSRTLTGFAGRMSSDHPDLADAARKASDAADRFADWLTTQAPSKTGSSGVGKENYSWNLRNVHLLPYSWEDEVLLMNRELARSHTSLRLEENRNRDLPSWTQIESAGEYDRRLNEAVGEYMDFLEDDQVLPIKNYMDFALRERMGSFSPLPSSGLRGFFSEVTYRDPLVMRTHHYHWFDLARMRDEPNWSPIRQRPLLYNIFDGRAEGMATGMEEMMMHAGLLDDRPRARELVWILLAQRAARGLGGLYQHGLEMTFDEATQFASDWVPWGLLPANGSTIQHEEQFYLQQPAYGTSYVIGKIEIEKLIAEYARKQEGKFVLSEFINTFNRSGVIPVSLIYWEMTGDKSMLLDAIGKQ